MNSVFKSLLVLSLALVGLGIKFEITNTLVRRNLKQRLEIARSYNEICDRDHWLGPDLSDLYEGHIEDLLVGLVRTLPEFLALEIEKSRGLVDIVLTSSNEMLKDIRGLLGKVPQVDENEFQHLTNSMINGAFEGYRSESQEVDVNAAIADAKLLREVGEMDFNRKPENITRFENIFIQRSYKQLRQIFEEYNKLFGHDIEEAFVDQYFGEQLESALKTVCSITRSAPNHYAKQLYDALNGQKIDTKTLTRIIVSRSEMDLEEIKAAFQTQYEKSLRLAIKERASGEYIRALRDIVGP